MPEWVWSVPPPAIDISSIAQPRSVLLGLRDSCLKMTILILQSLQFLFFVCSLFSRPIFVQCRFLFVVVWHLQLRFGMLFIKGICYVVIRYVVLSRVMLTWVTGSAQINRVLVSFMLLTVILIIISFPSPTHSFIPGLKPSFSANRAHRSLSFSSRLTTWIPPDFYYYLWAYPFLLFSFSVLHFLVVCSVR